MRLLQAMAKKRAADRPTRAVSWERKVSVVQGRFRDLGHSLLPLGRSLRCAKCLASGLRAVVAWERIGRCQGWSRSLNFRTK